MLVAREIILEIVEIVEILLLLQPISIVRDKSPCYETTAVY